MQTPSYPQQHMQPVQAVHPIPASTPHLNQPDPVMSKAVSAGIFGTIVVSTGALGANLHHVADGRMTMGQAVGSSLVSGISGGVAAASATAAATALTSGGAAGLAVTLATATGVSFMINKINR